MIEFGAVETRCYEAHRSHTHASRMEDNNKKRRVPFEFSCWPETFALFLVHAARCSRHTSIHILLRPNVASNAEKLMENFVSN